MRSTLPPKPPSFKDGNVQDFNKYVYSGFRAGPRAVVTYMLRLDLSKSSERALPPRNDLMNHSPDGFNWGYGGSGPAQLALAILAIELGDQDALRYYQEFKHSLIANIKDDKWRYTSYEVRAHIRSF